MDWVTPQEAAEAKLPDSRRDAILVLRALRDGGDMRGAAWAVVGYESADPRIRSEAVDAMNALAQSWSDQRNGFADHVDAAMPAFVEPVAARVRGMDQVPKLRPFADAVSEITSLTSP
jgi:hypothetical protein